MKVLELRSSPPDAGCLVAQAMPNSQNDLRMWIDVAGFHLILG